MNTKKMINLLTMSTSILLLNACGANFDKQASSLNEKTTSTPYQTEATQYQSSNYSSIDTPEKQEETQNQSTSQVNKVPSRNIKPKQTEPLSQKNKLGKLTVSSDRHMLQYADGQGFFWMGDTAWQLSYKLNKTEINHYLTDRKEKGFTVIQMSAVDSRWFPKNQEGKQPFTDKNFTPNMAYWENIDYIVDKAAENGLYIALLPAWNNVLKTTSEAKIYGKFVANRYKDIKNIIWIIGGDSDPSKGNNKAIWNILANTIHTIIGDKQLMSYHPSGFSSSAKWFNHEDWLDFNMVQSGHCGQIEEANNFFKNAYNASSAKPIFDGEPRYEDIEKCFYKEDRDHTRYTAQDTRKIAYEQVFSGAFGHTYGHQSIWQMFDYKYDESAGSVSKSWKNALNDPGASQMGYLSKLMKSRPILGRIPKQSIIKNGDGIATQGKGYAMVYLPNGGSVNITLNRVAKNVKAWWYNPQTGDATLIDTYKTATQKFTTGSDDMILVLDDISKDFGTPGQ